jgi:hypothetical protein
MQIRTESRRRRSVDPLEAARHRAGAMIPRGRAGRTGM